MPQNLRFRRGNTAQRSGSLQYGEPYVNVEINALQIGGLDASNNDTLYTFYTGSGGGIVSASVFPYTGSAVITGSLVVTGSITATQGITGSLYGTASYAMSSSIQYVSESYLNPLGQIEVKDYDNNVAVTYVNGKLTFIFGSPETPSITAFSFNSTFLTDRFNQITDNYTATATWSNGGYTLISASIIESGIVLTGTNTGTSLVYNTTTTGNHTYVLHVTASNPLDSSLLTISQSLTGTLSKSNPGTPSLTTTPTIQLGASSNQIEQGATGSIVFSSVYGASNAWEQVSLETTASYSGISPVSISPFYVSSSATGSNSIVISATASYQSPVGDNSPQIFSTQFSSVTYSKIRSLRAGASAATSFTQSELEDIDTWDTSLGGSIGTITKGTTNPSGNSVTITWTGDKYHYIVYDSSRSNLTNISSAGFSVLSSFTLSTVGQYKVYRSNTLQSGYSGTTITYSLT